jgi:hypothetical protein
LKVSIVSINSIVSMPVAPGLHRIAPSVKIIVKKERRLPVHEKANPPTRTETNH